MFLSDTGCSFWRRQGQGCLRHGLVDLATISPAFENHGKFVTMMRLEEDESLDYESSYDDISGRTFRKISGSFSLNQKVKGSCLENCCEKLLTDKFDSNHE